MSNSRHEEYWKNYTNLQFVKHNILKSYLGGWYPILSRWHGRIAYIDCHAGKGRHKSGEEGSPIIALRTLLEHHHRDRILKGTEVNFLFLEIDEENVEQLEENIEELQDEIGEFPNSVKLEIVCADYDEVINQILDDLEAEEQHMAPAFVFVDPFGFKLSMELMNRLLSFQRSELFINFMFRYVDMAMHNEAQEANMNSLFGCEDWKELSNIEDSEKRAEEVIKLYTERLQAEYTTWIRMIGEHRELKYVLIHASHAPKAKQLMKQAIWSTLLPSGEFTAYQSDNPYQGMLIEPEPDLSPLEDRVWEVCTGRQIYYEELLKEIELIETIYLESHLNKLLRQLRSDGIVKVSGYEGRFAFNKNPLFEFLFF